jgi:hypothetical protein
MKQLGIAIHNFQAAKTVFPAGQTYPAPSTGSVSVHVALLPFLEDQNLYNEYVTSTTQSLAIQAQIPVFDCPSDPCIEAVVDGGGPPPAPFTYRYSITYGFNYGTWFIYDWAKNISGDGAFVINKSYGPRAFIDGLSNTLAAAEVKAQTEIGGMKVGVGYIRSLKIPNVSDPQNSTLPASPAALLSLIGASVSPQMSSFSGDGSTLNSNLHLDYNNATVAETGFTTTFTPNTQMLISVASQNVGTGTPVSQGGNQVPNVSGSFDVDYISLPEKAMPSGCTFAAVTSRSYHSDIVNCVFMDGSVRAIDSTISPQVWHALGTRAGGEVFDENL